MGRCGDVAGHRSRTLAVRHAQADSASPSSSSSSLSLHHLPPLCTCREHRRFHCTLLSAPLRFPCDVRAPELLVHSIHERERLGGQCSSTASACSGAQGHYQLSLSMNHGQREEDASLLHSTEEEGSGDMRAIAAAARAADSADSVRSSLTCLLGLVSATLVAVALLLALLLQRSQPQWPYWPQQSESSTPSPRSAPDGASFSLATTIPPLPWCPPTVDPSRPKPWTWAKVQIHVVASHRPDFVPMQVRTLRRFMTKDSFEYVLWDNARDPNVTAAFIEVTREWGVRYMRLPIEEQGGHGPSGQHFVAVAHLMGKEGLAYNGTVMLLDSDMFLIAPFPWNELVPPYTTIANSLHTRPMCDDDPLYPGCHGQVPFLWDLVHTPSYVDPHAEQRVWYLWPNLVIFPHMPSVPDRQQLSWEHGTLRDQRMDTGGQTALYLESHKGQVNISNIVASWYDPQAWREQYLGMPQYARLRAARNLPLMQLIFPARQTRDDYSFVANYSILHYRAASRWDNKGEEDDNAKWTRFKAVVEEAERLDDIEQERCPRE